MASASSLEHAAVHASQVAEGRSQKGSDLPHSKRNMPNQEAAIDQNNASITMENVERKEGPKNETVAPGSNAVRPATVR